MRLVARPKLKTKLKTKAFKESAKLLRLTAGDKEAFTGRAVAHALPSFSRHCKMNLPISGAKEKKNKKRAWSKEKILPKQAFGWGRTGRAGKARAALSQAPGPHPPPAPGMLTFTSPSGATRGPIMTYINCLGKKISISLLFFLQRLGGTAAKATGLLSPWQQQAPGEAVGAQPSTCCVGWDG